MTIFSRFANKDFDIPFSAPKPTSQDDIRAAELIVEAGRRVGDRLGIHIDNNRYENAIVAVKCRDGLVTALQKSSVAVLDFNAVRAYQEHRVRRTLREQFVQGWNRISDEIEKHMMHNIGGKTSAFTALFVTLPVGIPLLIDKLWYDVAFGASYAVLLILFGIISGFYWLVLREEDDEAITEAGRAYAFLNLWILGFPFLVLASLTASWFLPGESGRKWKVLPAKAFFRKHGSDTTVALVMDEVLRVAPDAKLECESLMQDDAPCGDAFLAVRIDGSESDKLYVWHTRM